MAKTTSFKVANSNNEKIALAFYLLTKQIQNKIDNEEDSKKKNIMRFKLRSIQTGLKAIQKYEKKITNGKELDSLPGIGKGIISRINEIIDTGTLKELSGVKKNNKNDIIDELTQVINIGRSLANELIKKYNVLSVKDLKKRVKTGEIDVNDKVKIGLKYHGKVKLNIPRKEIDKVNEYLQKVVKKIDKDLVLEICGSYRRGKLTSNDIDILMTHPKIKTDKDKKKYNYLETVLNKLVKDKFLVGHLTKLDTDTKYMGFSRLKKNPIRRIDIRFVPMNSYASAKLYFTGSYELNKQMRNVAKEKGYKLNEYGLFRLKEDGSKGRKVTTKDEKSIFKKLGMKYLEPTKRNV